MSLTDRYEEMMERISGQRPVKKKYNPTFGADVEFCYKKTGHCTNTSGCNDCAIYKSVMEQRTYDANMKGE